ncbi:MAG: tryptophan synthase subunit beta [Pseudomonas sp.]|uniref:tryptophan synthase subunit beta n=1 Tax=Pseudomonas sp. TaxID=306 RepID=UPI00339232FC
MRYIQRDERQQIVRAASEPFEGMSEQLAAEDPELQAFLLHNRLASLQHSDLELVRVIEDLVGVLVKRGVIRYTDLPEAARLKLHQRAETRAHLGELSGLLGEDEHRLL